jgi:hypothetical protein
MLLSSLNHGGKKMTDSKMTSYVTSKPDTQAMIKALRAAGATVTKDSLGGYHCKQLQHATKDGVRTGKTREITLFVALPGRNGYLIRRVADLFG